MNNELLDMNTINSSSDDEFLSNINSVLSVKTNFEKKEYNYLWIDIIEETLPYLDNIVRNPKRFIINEEEIVKVELARKVTVESVIHLTQHTNLIQDVDEKTGDVKPSKILNINKDENLDTYENRFIYTLLLNLNHFFEEHSKNLANESFYLDKKNFSYKGNTRIGTENIEVVLEMSSVDQNKTDLSNEQGMSITDRLKKIKIQLDGFSCSELMQTLSRAHVPLVRSPIRKTNVILKNPNFQKAEQLWNFLQSYDQDDCKHMRENQDYVDFGELKKQYDQSFLYNYIANKNLSVKGKKNTSNSTISLVMDCLIRNILDYDMDIDEKLAKTLFDKKLKAAKNDIALKSKKVSELLIDQFEKNNQEIERIFFNLGGKR